MESFSTSEVIPYDRRNGKVWWAKCDRKSHTHFTLSEEIHFLTNCFVRVTDLISLGMPIKLYYNRKEYNFLGQFLVIFWET